ncbi:retinoid-binding protein 7 isoform X1 [Eschrichtius robustus]|uniref:retinoid-binding protein 7 isoform X1 n=1 Tax=Eschrichtius robustus TaxID=9764 RepID=UPI0035BFD02A
MWMFRLETQQPTHPSEVTGRNHRARRSREVPLPGQWSCRIITRNCLSQDCLIDTDFATRKIAKLLKPQKVIEQNGDSFTIHTNSSFRNYLVKFKVGEEFDEDNKGLDNRKCKSLVIWDNDRLTCVQKGEKKNRGWTHWIEGDQLHLEMFCEGQVCKQTFQRA